MPGSTKEVRGKLDPETCAVCGRRLLQGENVNWFIAPDASRRPVCELCAPRADRARWVREREGEEVLQLRPARAARGGFARRVLDFFSGAEEDELADSLSEVTGDQGSRRQARASRRRERHEIDTQLQQPPRNVQAVPIGTGSRLEQGLHLFNESQFPRTIAGLTRSLGEPKVRAMLDPGDDTAVDVYVGWEIAWYSYRVDLGDATEPVEQSGRGNDVAELGDKINRWNAFADEYGRLYMSGPPPGSASDSRSSADSASKDSDAAPDAGASGIAVEEPAAEPRPEDPAGDTDTEEANE